MRYRLRTLLILLAIAPPLLAAGWWIVELNPFGTLAAFIGAMILASIPASLLALLANPERERYLRDRKP